MLVATHRGSNVPLHSEKEHLHPSVRKSQYLNRLRPLPHSDAHPLHERKSSYDSPLAWGSKATKDQRESRGALAADEQLYAGAERVQERTQQGSATLKEQLPVGCAVVKGRFMYGSSHAGKGGQQPANAASSCHPPGPQVGGTAVAAGEGAPVQSCVCAKQPGTGQ